jgi:flagellar basal-body rod modification protein FlgD
MSYVDTTGVLLGAQESRLAASNTPTDETSLGQDDFLNILVAQLTHQDPLNPMQDTDMTSQLAQFSSLEQLTNINQGIQDLGDSMTQSDMLSAVSFIGKEIKAEGYKISVSEGNASTVYYGFGEAVSSIYMNIYDSEGAIVRTVELGSKEAGTYQYEWDGRNEGGDLVPDGTYGVGILGKDVNGDAVLVQTEISGTVDAVVNESGTQYLRLKDGRFVSFLNVKEIVDPGSASVTDDTETTDEAEDTGS